MWYEIPKFPGYRISIQGEIMSLRQSGGPRIMKKTIDSKGYYVVGLRQNGKTVVKAVHLFVAMTFLGPCPEGLQVCHNDGNRLNNHRRNLRYDTPSENNYDLVRHGTHYEANRTHCDQGHEYTPENTMWRWAKPGKSSGKKYRKCRACHNLAQAEQRAKLKARTGLTYRPKKKALPDPQSLTPVP